MTQVTPRRLSRDDFIDTMTAMLVPERVADSVEALGHP